MIILATATAICCVTWALVAGLSAVRYCQRRGVSVHPVVLRIEMLKCLSQYRRLTREESGHVGPLFYHYVIPINAALVLVIVLLFMRLA